MVKGTTLIGHLYPKLEEAEYKINNGRLKFNKLHKYAHIDLNSWIYKYMRKERFLNL